MFKPYVYFEARTVLMQEKHAPPHEEVAFALGKLLSAAGMADNMQGTSVAAVSGTRRPAYHLLTPEPSTKPVSEILTGVLARSFPPDQVSAPPARVL
jgi:hypothetical protein